MGRGECQRYSPGTLCTWKRISLNLTVRLHSMVSSRKKWKLGATTTFVQTAVTCDGIHLAFAYTWLCDSKLQTLLFIAAVVLGERRRKSLAINSRENGSVPNDKQQKCLLIVSSIYLHSRSHKFHQLYKYNTIKLTDSQYSFDSDKDWVCKSDL